MRAVKQTLSVLLWIVLAAGVTVFVSILLLLGKLGFAEERQTG